MPISQIKTICEISVREWSIRRFLAARMDFFSVVLELFVLFIILYSYFITHVKYPAAIVLVMISKISLI